jgi:hypothetical protein
MSSGLPLKADIAQYSRHVSKVPHKRTHALQQTASLFDHLGGGGKKRLREAAEIYL